MYEDSDNTDDENNEIDEDGSEDTKITDSINIEPVEKR